MFCQRLVIEMDGILVLFFFEVGIANSSISSDKKKKEFNKGRVETSQPLQRKTSCNEKQGPHCYLGSTSLHYIHLLPWFLQFPFQPCQQNRFYREQPSSPYREIQVLDTEPSTSLKAAAHTWQSVDNLLGFLAPLRWPSHRAPGIYCSHPFQSTQLPGRMVKSQPLVLPQDHLTTHSPFGLASPAWLVM